MNRAQRRAKAQRAPVVRKMPRLIDEMRVFSGINAVLDQLQSGEIDTVNGEMIIARPDEGNWYEVPPAIGGWVSMWSASADISASPCNWMDCACCTGMLRDGTRLLPEHVDLCRAEVEQQRQIFRTHDRKQLMSLANTESIALYMQGKQHDYRHPHQPASSELINIMTRAGKPLTSKQLFAGQKALKARTT